MDQFQRTLDNLLQTMSAAELNSSLATIVNQQAQMSVRNGSATPASNSGSKSRRRRQLTQNNKAKRPLNAFIAYRSYYSPIFKGIPQKVKSGLMRETWCADNKSTMWALLGSAYSDLRDHHDQFVALDKFLALAVPLLPIVPANEYLSKMGWEILVDTNNAEEPVLVRSSAFNADRLTAEYPPFTHLSVADIVNHCYDQGLLPRETRKHLTRNRAQHMFRDAGNPAGPAAGTGTPGTPPPPPPPAPCRGGLILAVAPQASTTMDVGETSTSNGSNNGTEQTTTTPELTSDSEEEGEAIVVAPEVLEAAAVEGGMLYTMTATNTTDNAASGDAGELGDAETDAEAEAGVEGEEDERQEEEVLIHEAIMTSNTYLTIAAITADQQAAFEDNDLALHFHPGIEPPILGFDPRIVQDDFDPFDLDFSGLIDFDTNMSE